MMRSRRPGNPGNLYAINRLVMASKVAARARAAVQLGVSVIDSRAAL